MDPIDDPLITNASQGHPSLTPYPSSRPLDNVDEEASFSTSSSSTSPQQRPPAEMVANYNTISSSAAPSDPSGGTTGPGRTAGSGEQSRQQMAGSRPSERPLLGGRTPSSSGPRGDDVGSMDTSSLMPPQSSSAGPVSFKRRATPGGRGPSFSGSAGPREPGRRALSGFLSPGRRPSTAEGRPRRSFAAASQASVEAISRWRNFRKTQTLSVHPPVSGDPEDPSSWSFSEPKPQIPSLLPDPNANPDATPIPLLPFTVLCLVCFGEFSSSGVAGPFLFFMIDSFKVGGESDVGFWAGITSSVFFFAQFLTSLLWASIADRYGRRAVLLASLCGNALTLATFGTSTNLKMALTVRLAQGLFNGAVGVAKGAIRDLTDSTNEGRAYAILGFAWGFGGIAGPILGGVLEHPAEKFPAIFGNIELFKTYPYLLPCLAGASFTSLGAFLSLFIGPDGGPRQGQIRLQDDAAPAGETTIAPARNAIATAAENIDSLGRSAGKRISGYFAGNGTGEAGAQDIDGAAGGSQISLGRTSRGQQPQGGFPRTFTQQVDEETGGPPSPVDSDDEGTVITRRSGKPAQRRTGNRTGFGRSDWDARLGYGYSTSGAAPSASGFSRTEERRRGVLGGGSAYGYDPRQSRLSTFSALGPDPGSGVGMRRNVRGASFGAQQRQQPGVHGASASGANARYSFTPSAMGSAYNYAPDFEAVGADPALAPMPRKLNFAQRFLLANDDAVLSITDLWVAAAINGDEAYTAADDDDDDGDDELYEDDNGGDLDGEGDSQAIDSSFDVGSSSQEYDEDDFDEDDDRLGVGRLQGASGIGNDGISEGGRDRPYLPPLNMAQRRRESRGARAVSSGTRPRSMRMPSAQGRVPSLYQNTGIDLPSPWNEAPPSLPAGGGYEASAAAGAAESGQGGAATSRYDPTLAGIPESHSARNTLGRVGGQGTAEERQHLINSSADDSLASTQVPEKAVAPSLWALLPMTVIAHYGLLAFHSATFDQVFMAFLVTPFPSGGLGLTAAHYAELISAMAFCQIGFQFYFYPKVGPPQGKFSHLSMMRLGTLLYLPTYTLFPLLRNFLHPETDALVMTFMIVFASMRWLANICAFTAVSILMNALTPPNLVPLANGLAQTTSSAARFLGPILGGLVWAKGISGDFTERSWPWNYHLGFWFVGLAGFAGFLHATFVLRSSSGSGSSS
ncbi:unnamed protein product [Parajaminaea phylloscopi]